VKLGFLLPLCGCEQCSPDCQSLPINATIYRGPIPRVGSDEVAFLGQKWTKIPLQWAGFGQWTKRT